MALESRSLPLCVCATTHRDLGVGNFQLAQARARFLWARGTFFALRRFKSALVSPWFLSYLMRPSSFILGAYLVPSPQGFVVCRCQNHQEHLFGRLISNAWLVDKLELSALSSAALHVLVLRNLSSTRSSPVSWVCNGCLQCREAAVG